MESQSAWGLQTYQRPLACSSQFCGPISYTSESFQCRVTQTKLKKKNLAMSPDVPRPLSTGFEPVQHTDGGPSQPGVRMILPQTDQGEMAPGPQNEACTGQGRRLLRLPNSTVTFSQEVFIKSLGRRGYFFLKLPRVLIIRHRVRLSSLKRYERAK